MESKEKIKQEWNNLNKWVKIVIIILGIVLLFFLVSLIPRLLDLFGGWIGKILHILGY